MRVLVVSPHYDDAPLSLGQSLVDGELSNHRVSAGIVFGRSNWVRWFQPTRSRWRLATGIRVAEERYNAVRFGYRVRRASLEEAVLRLDDMNSERFLVSEFDAASDPALEAVTEVLRAWARRADMILAPLGLGDHIDHQIATAAACRLLAEGVEVGFYEDRPYAVGLDEETITAAAHRIDARLERRAVSGPMDAGKHRRLFYPSQFDEYFTTAIAADERDSAREFVWVLPESTFAPQEAAAGAATPQPRVTPDHSYAWPSHGRLPVEVTATHSLRGRDDDVFR